MARAYELAFERLEDQMPEPRNTFGADADEDVTDWGEVNMEEKRSLKPCPFCGNAAGRVDIEDEGENFGGSCIECTSCGASTALHFDRKENLYSSWNERAADVTNYDNAPTDPHHGGKIWKE